MQTFPPHPADTGFAEAYSRAWTEDPEGLCAFFAEDGVYEDVAMGEPAVQAGRAYYEWTWSGSINGALRLPDGSHVDAAGKDFSVTGIASCRFDSAGKLTSHRDFWDVGLLVEQLGRSLTAAPA